MAGMFKTTLRMAVFDYTKKRAPRKLEESMGEKMGYLSAVLWVEFYTKGSHCSQEFAKTYSFTDK